MVLSPYRFYDLSGVDLNSDRFPFGECKGMLFSECKPIDCCILSHMFPCTFPKLNSYLESIGYLKVNSFYYPPDIIRFMNADFLTIHEKTRILEELFYGSFTITPTTKYVTMRSHDFPERGCIWSTTVSGFSSATPKYKRPDYLTFNPKYPHRYDVMGTKNADSVPIMFIFERVLWKNGENIGVPVQDNEPVPIDNVQMIRVTDFELMEDTTNVLQSTPFRGFLRVLIKRFSVVI